jgi:uncharacterized protein
MQIDWANFTPLGSLAGGILIGASAGLTALLLGRIAGISGILAGLIPPRAGDRDWRLAFLLGLLAAPLFIGLVHPTAHPTLPLGAPLAALAGLLVGFGARLGGGCTSGHAVCGLSRLSLRSFVATAAFMASAMTVVYLLRHVAS